MIDIPQPAMAWNAVDVPGPDYKMWNTMQVDKSLTPQHVIESTASVARGAPDGKLKALVINCHGFYADIGCNADGTSCKKGGGFGLSIGKGGILRKDVQLFGILNPKDGTPLIDDIYIVACGIAQISIPGTSGDGDGNLFCCAIAKASGANVYASTAKQSTGWWLSIPYGKIDGFEGKVYMWKPDGSCSLTNL
jgi:hypothetical protein